MKTNLNIVILAAGKGTRMKSDKLKVLHEVAGKPMIIQLLITLNRFDMTDVFVVMGYKAESLKKVLIDYPVQFVSQKEQLGTGHAVMEVVGQAALNDDCPTLVLAGDVPLIKANTIDDLLEDHLSQKAAVTILSTALDDPAQYGRILRSDTGDVIGIREFKDCSDEQKAINEINSGIYLFDTRLLKKSLKKVTNDNNQNEYYLTDVVHILNHDNQKVVGHLIEDSNQVLGVNSVADLERVNAIFDLSQ
jgi:bifunctional UDP-N-acetylglucosamine pyrophosphorylase/glucosamine-1-phosphate N-acetyltransferase